jgi:hypothetical protein
MKYFIPNKQFLLNFCISNKKFSFQKTHKQTSTLFFRSQTSETSSPRTAIMYHVQRLLLPKTIERSLANRLCRKLKKAGFQLLSFTVTYSWLMDTRKKNCPEKSWLYGHPNDLKPNLNIIHRKLQFNTLHSMHIELKHLRSKKLTKGKSCLHIRLYVLGSPKP